MGENSGDTMKRQTVLGGDHFLLKAADPVGLCLNFEVPSTGGKFDVPTPRYISKNISALCTCMPRSNLTLHVLYV
mgnify:CR=1 FL=1